jgi:hypothetical protein
MSFGLGIPDREEQTLMLSFSEGLSATNILPMLLISQAVICFLQGGEYGRGLLDCNPQLYMPF